MPIRQPIKASVVICTHNRAGDLDKTCRHLLDSMAISDRCELVLVDSASTDNTHQVVLALSEEYPDRFRAVAEDQQGLSIARNSGIRNSTGEIVVFVDDDALPCRSWLESLVGEFHSPQTWAAGGPVIPQISAQFPEWFSALFLPYLSAWDLGDRGQDLTYNNYPRGTNIAFRRTAFDHLGRFMPQLGRKGRSLRSCEEIEFCLRIERAGHKIRYVPEAQVHHKVDIERLSASWMINRFRAQGFSEAIMEWHHAGFEGIKTGLKRGWSNVRHSRSRSTSTDQLMGDCLVGALRGYWAGSLYAATRIGRFQPTDPSRSIRAWLPSG
jgi:glycosyltransferase involved in cell wall biosynthesis